jgi:hypothetical protein
MMFICFPFQEDQDNMEIERLAELLRSERSGNAMMADSCKNDVVESAAVFIQRVARGHIGRKKFHSDAEKIWLEQSKKTSIILQAAYRGMIGRRAARLAALAEQKNIMQDASRSIQRILRGKQSRVLVGEIRKEVNKIDQTFFRSRGRSEAKLFEKRNKKTQEQNEDETSDSDSDESSSFIVPEHPRPGCKLHNVPSYGAYLRETPKDHNCPQCRHKSPSFSSGTSEDEDSP